jgi:hypothetical protein
VDVLASGEEDQLVTARLLAEELVVVPDVPLGMRLGIGTEREVRQ